MKAVLGLLIQHQQLNNHVSQTIPLHLQRRIFGNVKINNLHQAQSNHITNARCWITSNRSLLGKMQKL
jgi:hypothetical protein